MTVLGLGNMGRALAQALLNEGHKVTVWNRTAARAEALVRNGATLAKSPTEAIAASQLTIMCVLDNESARAILESSVTGQSFAGKTLVQFTTGTADELNAQRDWISSNGGHFIAGGILVFPSGIGKPNTLIVYAGEPEAFETSRALLSGLGGSPHYLGSDSCAVVGAFFTLATFGAGALSMFYETAALARQFGLDIETYHALAEKIVDALLRDGMHEATEKVTSGLFHRRSCEYRPGSGHY